MCRSHCLSCSHTREPELSVTIILTGSDNRFVVLVMCVIPRIDFSGVSFSIPCLQFPCCTLFAWQTKLASLFFFCLLFCCQLLDSDTGSRLNRHFCISVLDDPIFHDTASHIILQHELFFFLCYLIRYLIIAYDFSKH